MTMLLFLFKTLCSSLIGLLEAGIGDRSNTVIREAAEMMTSVSGVINPDKKMGMSIKIV